MQFRHCLSLCETTIAQRDRRQELSLGYRLQPDVGRLTYDIIFCTVLAYPQSIAMSKVVKRFQIELFAIADTRHCHYSASQKTFQEKVKLPNT